MHRTLTSKRGALGLAVLLALGSCAPAPRPAPLPPPARPAPTPAPPPPAPAVQASSLPWDEMPVIEGSWRYDPARRSARFVDDGGLERAGLACSEPGRTLALTLFGDRAAAVDVLTSAGTSRHGLVDGEAVLPSTDIALDRIAFSRGRFALRASTLLVLPVQAEIGRVIEDCRG